MKIRSAEFAACAVDLKQCPTDGLPEIVLVGRSNVGKSSLINALVNRKGLAKTSSAPGKTRTINFYRINKAFYIVDLPGFGYAEAPVAVRKEWASMIEAYLAGRKSIAGAMVVLDIRRDVAEYEEDLFAWLDSCGLAPYVVFTKSDKLTGNKLRSKMAQLKKLVPDEEPVFFSAHTGAGVLELSRKVETILSAGDGRH